MRPMIDGGGSAPNPQPPPPPTAEALAQASGEDAGRAVEAMTPEQQTALVTEVEALPATERTDLANNLAAKLDADQLQALVPVFGQDAMLDAVQTRSPATVREAYESQAGIVPADSSAEPSGRDASEQVSQAQSDYAEQVEGQGIMAQHGLGDLMTANAGDPAYLAELVRLANEDGVLDMAVNPMYGGLFEKQDGEYVVTNENASFDADARRAAFATAIGAAIDEGVLTETDLRGFATNSSGWADVAGRAGVGQVGATEATTTTSTELGGVIDDYNDARDDVDELNEELGGMLAQAGPMTPEQQAAFVKAFREDPENAGAYARLTETTTALSDYMTQNTDAVLDAAVRDPAVAQQVHDALVGMAEDGRGIEVVELLTEINAGGSDSALAEAFAGFDDLSGPVLEKASSAAMTQLLDRNNGDVTAAAAAFETMFNSLVQAWPAKAGVDDVRLGAQLLDAAGKGDVRALQVYLTEIDAKSPMLRALVGAGVVLGAVGAINAGTHEDYTNMIAGFAQSGENAARLVAGSMGSMAAVGQALEGSARFANFAAKIAPGLGLIANTASLVNSIHEASDGNVGYAFAAIGDVVGILGSALEFTPAAPVGFIVSGIGAVISGAGSFVGEIINGNERREELEKYLKAAGVDEAIVDEMANSGKQLFEMVEALGMTPDQVQSLLLAHPDIGGAPGLAGAFTDVAVANGISGNDVIAFANAMAEERADFAWDLMGIGSSAPTNPAEREAFYRDYVENAYSGASEIAQEASPELFGAAAEDREQAVFDYNQVSGSSSWEMGVANLLKNNDSAAYQAEVMRLLAEGGDQRLEMFAEMISGYGDNWSGAVQDAVAAAVEAGTLSQEQSDLVLGYF